MGRVLLLLLFYASATALFQDQAGTFDWYKNQIGDIEVATFAKSKPRACFLSKLNVIGCLNLRDGSVSWRKQFSDAQSSYSMIASEKPSLLIMIEHYKRSVHAFEQQDGYLSYTVASMLEDNSVESIFSGLYEYNGWQHLVMVGDKMLQMNNGSEEVFRSDLVHVQSAKVLISQKDSQLIVTRLSLNKPEVHWAVVSGLDVVETSSILPIESSTIAVAESWGALYVSASYEELCKLTFPSDDVAGFSSCQKIADLVPTMSQVSSNMELLSTKFGAVLVSRDLALPGAVLLAHTADGMRNVQSFPGVMAAAVGQDMEGHAVVLLASQEDTGYLRLRVVSASDASVLAEETVKVPTPPYVAADSPQPRLRNIFLGTYKRAIGGSGFRYLLCWTDARISMVQQSQIVWTREEVLAGAHHPLFLDLPPKAVYDTHDAHLQQSDLEGDGFQRWLRYQFLNVKTQLKLVTPEEADEALRLREVLSDKALPYRDANGFRKIIVMASPSGQLVAVHSGDGHILWSRSVEGDFVPAMVLSWRTHHDATTAPQVAALWARPSGELAFASIVDVYSGREVEKIQLGEAKYKVIPLVHPVHDGRADQSVYLLATEPSTALEVPAVKLLPASPAALSYFEANYRSVFFWLKNPTASGLTGYAFSRPDPAQLAADLKPQRVWGMVFPDPLLTVVARSPSEHVHTSVKISSDRNIRYKYLNPNTLFVATSGQGAGPSGITMLRLSIMLLDSVTGAVKYSATHPGCTGPVAAVAGDNWVVYTYWNSITARLQITVLELFDATPRTFNVLDYLFNPNFTAPTSSFHDTPVNVTSQSYYVREGAKLMAVTSTARGISSKQLLYGTETDQVYALDKRFVDPRRPMRQKLTAEEMEERLVPYADTIPFFSPSYATLDKTILGLSGIAVQPSRLESTTLMLAHGIDLFFTRLLPSKAYDSLDDEFSYALLVLATGALAAGTAVVAVMAKTALLKRKWR